MLAEAGTVPGELFARAGVALYCDEFVAPIGQRARRRAMPLPALKVAVLEAAEKLRPNAPTRGSVVHSRRAKSREVMHWL
jgi:hypothetical protein